MDQINFTAWENRTETCSGGVSMQQAQMAQATLGMDTDSVAEGDPLPGLWHWFAFLPQAPTAGLGRDGHPPLGDFLPPIRLQRRMWAGGALSFHTPLHVGEKLERLSTIKSVKEKDGAAGPMVFVSIVHEVFGSQGLAITEQQDIVYLDIPDRFVPPRKQPAPVSADFAEPVDASAQLLFRYSALTFNTHRIHYDLPYTQEVEHYTGLVVHGPLQATLLIDAATRAAGRHPDRFTFRAVHPVFAGEALQVQGQRSEDGSMNLCTAVTSEDDIYQGMQATAEWEERG